MDRRLRQISALSLACVACGLARLEPGNATPPATERPLPGYALGQPLDEARRVVPQGETGSGWVLRCAGDFGAPPDLGAVPTGPDALLRCWPMHVGPDGEVRSSAWRRHEGATEELSFRHGRLVRIRIDAPDRTGAARSVVIEDRSQPGR